MQQLLLQLLSVFTPIVMQAIADHKTANNGVEPTSDEVMAKLRSDADKYLGEGAAWTESHPRPPTP